MDDRSVVGAISGWGCEWDEWVLIKGELTKRCVLYMVTTEPKKVVQYILKKSQARETEKQDEVTVHDECKCEVTGFNRYYMRICTTSSRAERGKKKEA
jgi:hypothetical protein